MLEKLKNIIFKDTKSQETNNIQKLKFEQIMDMAKQISIKNPNSLIDLIKLLAKPYQSNSMLRVLTSLTKNEIKEVKAKEIFFDEFEEIPFIDKSLYNIKTEMTYSRPLELKTDIILPWPWNQYRIVENLCYIGQNRLSGPWQQDSNHKIEYWLPFGIGFVHGGNHSITNGILNGTGTINNYTTYDISDIYKYLICDGDYYYNKKDNSKFKKVQNLEFACVFEIGRIMHNLNITA